MSGIQSPVSDPFATIKRMFDSGRQCADHRLNGCGQRFMLPNAHYVPTSRGQRHVGSAVALDVTTELGRPIPLVGIGLTPVNWANMPETAIHKNRHLAGGEHDIWPDRRIIKQDPEVLAVSITEPMKCAAQFDFGFRVGSTVGAHIPRSSLVQRSWVQAARMRPASSRSGVVVRLTGSGCHRLSPSTARYIWQLCRTNEGNVQ